MSAPYTFKLAMDSLWKEKWINLLSALTIATGLLLMAVALSVLYNIQIATRKLPERFVITVFLKEGLTEEKIRDAVSGIKANPKVKSAKYISKDAAMKELKALMKDSDYILEGLDENPLPASVEVGINKEAVSEPSVRAFSDELRAIEGIEDVSYGEKLLSSIQAIKSGAEGIGALVIIILSAGITFVCYSTVKILFYRKKDEIETLQLLGATKGFIRAPFVLEGGLIGLAGGLAALSGIAGLKYLISIKLASLVPVLQSFAYPSAVAVYLPVAGLFVGLLGALIAIGRLRF
ncbi:MAG: permease-like cell division protein FtsX [Thermodesulfovibrionales bacterium]|nr:permease-like cell division protein FtsX [Thermodesulfovibrionales bacterium]